MTTITSGLSVYTANSVAPTATSGAAGVAATPTTAKASPTISLSNSSKVTLSKASVVTVPTTLMNASDAVKAYKAAILADPPVTPSAGIDQRHCGQSEGLSGRFGGHGNGGCDYRYCAQ